MPKRGRNNTWGVPPNPEDVKRLHAAGESRNGTARALGVTTRQVDKVAAEIGVSWSADATLDATEARRATAEIERLELAAKFRALATRALDRALTEEDAADMRRLSMTAESAARSDLRIWERDTAGEDGTKGGEEFVELLDALRGNFETLDEMPVDELDPTGEFECSPHPEDSPAWE